jgi:hypothetical protein
MKTFLALAFASLVTVAAFADGNLGYSLKTREGFWRVDVAEKDAVREGVISIMGSRYYLTSYEQDGRLYMPFAQYSNDNLEIKVWDEKHTWYRGFLWGNVLTNVDSYKDMKKGTMRLVGKIGDNLDFEYRTDVNKKGKKTAYLYWFDKAERQPIEMILEIEFTPTKQEGSCKGVLYAQTDEVARFACKSDGKLMDALYKSEADVLAWIIHLLIQPADADRRTIMSQVLKR